MDWCWLVVVVDGCGGCIRGHDSAAVATDTGVIVAIAEVVTLMTT